MCARPPPVRWASMERAGEDTGPYERSASVGADVPIGPSFPNAADVDGAGGHRPPLRVRCFTGDFRLTDTARRGRRALRGAVSHKVWQTVCRAGRPRPAALPRSGGRRWSGRPQAAPTGGYTDITGKHGGLCGTTNSRASCRCFPCVSTPDSQHFMSSYLYYTPHNMSCQEEN